MPAVTVMIPVRAAAATLEEALASVAAQSAEDFEVLLVEDGRDELTSEILQAWTRGDARFRWIRSPGDGLIDALAAGLASARGDLVARFDADDRMHPDRLAQQREALVDDPDLAGVGCHVRFFPDADVTDGMRRYESWLASIRGDPHDPQDPWGVSRVRREAFIECPLAHPTWLMRRGVLVGAGGYRDRGWPEDYDLLLRLLGAGHRLGVVPRVLHEWREAPGRHSRTHARYAETRFVACKAEALAQGLLAGSERYVLWGHGPTGRRLRAALAELGREPALIVEVHPRRLGQVIGGAPVISPEALLERPREAPLVASVAGADARRHIRNHLERAGWVELRDFVVAA